MYTPIVATLGYVLSEDRRKTLLVHRNLRTDDPHYGKYNGLGGKMDGQKQPLTVQKSRWPEQSAGLALVNRVRTGSVLSI